ncbi:MAG: DMT family transporter [Candidatus Levybacteria bacterium]|nr:DMT family transporter [Candidatus Levybacteria bacterium]MBI2420929.1 DMT family transporter [Candidatus Levybacteria bacterium]
MISNQGLFFALTTAFLFAAFGLLSRYLSKESKYPLGFAIIYGAISSILTVPFIFIEPWRFGNLTPLIIFVTFLATLFFGLFEANQFFARKNLEASRLSIFFQITPVVTFFGSLIFLSESITLQKTVGVGIIFAGNLIAVYKHGGHITPRGLFYALASVIALGLAYVADKRAFSYYPLGLYMLISYFFPIFYIFILMPRNRLISIQYELKRTGWKTFLLAIFSVSGYYMVLKTFQLTEASVAIPIIFSSTVLTALGGIIILKERTSIPQKIIGAIVVVTGVTLLSI